MEVVSDGGVVAEAADKLRAPGAQSGERERGQSSDGDQAADVGDAGAHKGVRDRGMRGDQKRDQRLDAKAENTEVAGHRHLLKHHGSGSRGRRRC